MALDNNITCTSDKVGSNDRLGAVTGVFKCLGVDVDFRSLGERLGEIVSS
jgi:hypothetical protein